MALLVTAFVFVTAGPAAADVVATTAPTATLSGGELEGSATLLETGEARDIELSIVGGACDITSGGTQSLPSAVATAVTFTASCADGVDRAALRLSVADGPSFDLAITSEKQGDPPWWWIGFGFAVGLVVMRAVPGVTYAVARSHLSALTDGDIIEGKIQGLPSGATWKLTDSWASNLTALVAILGTILGLTDVTKVLLDDNDVLVFAVGNAVFLAIVGAAPTIYTACQRWLEKVGDKNVRTRYLVGTPLGLFAAGGVVVVGVTGTLFLTVVLVVAAEVTTGLKVLGVGLLLATLALVVVYVVRTLDWQIRDALMKADEAEAGVVPTGIVAYTPTEAGRPPQRRFISL